MKEINLSEFAYSNSRQAAPAISANISVDTGERFADINYLLNERGAAPAVSSQEVQQCKPV